MTDRTLDFIIRNQKMNVAVEDISGVAIKDFFGKIFTKGVFTKLQDRTKEVTKSKVASGFKMKSNFTPKIIDWANRESYLNIADVTVFAPVGLKVSYMEYIDALENALTYIVDLDSELLHPTLRTLSMALNDPSLLAAASGLSASGKMANLNIEVATTGITKAINPTEKSDKIKYKQAFKRNADMVASGKRLIDIQDNVSKINASAVQARVTAIFAVAEELADAINNEEAYSKVSKKVNGQLSQLIYNCAQWVEFYAIFQHRLIVLSTAMFDTQEKLKRLSK